MDEQPVLSNQVRGIEFPETSDLVSSAPLQRTPAPLQIDPDSPPWGIGAAVLTWAGSIAFLVVTQVACVIPYIVWIYKKHPELLQAVLARPLEDKTLVFVAILSTLPAHFLTVGLVWATVTKFGKRPFWRALGWSWGKRIGFWSTAGLAVLLLALGVAITSAIGGEKTELEKMVESSKAAVLLTAFMATLTAPLAEEMVYRGVLYSAFHKRIGALWSVITVSALFAGVHVFQYSANIGVIAAIGLLSLALTILRAYSGRLLPSYIVHLIFNGVQSVALVLSPYIERFSSHPSTNPSAVVFWIK